MAQKICIHYTSRQENTYEYAAPTNPFTISNLSIDFSVQHKIRPSMDFEGLKLWKGRLSGLARYDGIRKVFRAEPK